jgi:hypothetical protein
MQHAEEFLKIADCISDGILVAMVTIVSIVHAVFLLGPSGYLEGVTANVEVRALILYKSLPSNDG